jgi:hypothetical protein
MRDDVLFDNTVTNRFQIKWLLVMENIKFFNLNDHNMKSLVKKPGSYGNQVNCFYEFQLTMLK